MAERACLFPIWRRGGDSCKKSRSHVSLPLRKKRNSLYWSSSKLKGYETPRISVSSVSRFELCKFPSRPSVAFFFFASSLLLPFIFEYAFYFLFFLFCLPHSRFCLSFHLHVPNLDGVFSRGPHQNAVFRRQHPSPPCCSISLHAGPWLPPRWKVRDVPHTVSVNLSGPFKIFYVCLCSPRLGSTNGLRVVAVVVEVGFMFPVVAKLCGRAISGQGALLICAYYKLHVRMA